MFVKEIEKTIERMPYLLPIETRFFAFRKMVNENYRGSYHGAQNLTIHRGREFEDAFNALHKTNLKDRIRVRFINELGQE